MVHTDIQVLRLYNYPGIQVYKTVYLTCITITEAVLLLEPRTEVIQWSTGEEMVRNSTGIQHASGT